MAVTMHPFAMAHAGDASGVAAALRDVPGGAGLVLVAKVPGPASLNDPSRELAQIVFRDALGGAPCRMILSVGCEGIASAGGILLADDGVAHPGGPERLAMGSAESSVIPAAARGLAAHSEAVAIAVRAAVQAAGLVPGEVRLVLVKSPVRRDQDNATGRARGAAALGVALALGEVGAVGDAILADPVLYSARAMTMSGTEVDRAEVVVLGNRAGAGGALTVGSAVLRDLLDIGGLRAMLRGLGLCFDMDGVLISAPGAGAAFPFVLLKAGLAGDGAIRGRAIHAIGTDMPPDKHLRAAASGVLASVLGQVGGFVTGGAEHQGPPGACIAAAIAPAVDHVAR